LIGYESALNDFFKGDPSARRQFDPISLGTMPIEEAKEKPELKETADGKPHRKR